MNIIETLAKEFNLKVDQVEKTVALIDEGNTIPFIARYRKEVTGSLDDNILRDLNDRLTFLRNIEKRKQEVSDLITAQGKMTPEIQAAILNSASAYVKHGGRLVYSTCTLLPDENEEQVLAFLAKHPEFVLCPFAVGEVQSEGMLTLAPDTHGTDGFFVAKLKKTV